MEEWKLDLETPVSEMTKEQQAMEYINLRIDHLKKTELDREAAKTAKAEEDKIAEIKKEIGNYFK
jgi:hypothetical protein